MIWNQQGIDGFKVSLNKMNHVLLVSVLNVISLGIVIYV